ncbi:MAG: AAA family ATPase [Bacteroidales bacterium]
MAKLKSITIENYRSIGNSPVTIKFPENQPVILIGENNSGKTNIIRAIEILFGEWNPKYKEFDDHDYYNRSANNKIIIKAEVSDFQNKLGKNSEHSCKGFKLEKEKEKGKEVKYVAIQEDRNENFYVSNDLREELSAILVSSEQNLTYQLSYSTKYTLLSKVTKAFHEKLTSDEMRVNKLKELYSQILKIFDDVEEFKDFKGKMSSITGKFIQNMTHGLQLDFSAYDPSNYFKNLRVLPHENNESRNFDELGTGQQQILALSFAHAYAQCFKNERGLILIIDEPEVHLHPLAQKWLAKTLFDMAKDGLQVVITTHSPYFIDLEFLEGIYLVRKDSEGTYVKNLNKNSLAEFCQSKGAKKANADTIIPFYYKSATFNILKGFFAKKVILVEGMTEELALPIYLERLGLDVLEKGIDIIGVGGKGELAKWWRFFTAFEIPCYVCFDNDAKDDNEGNKRKDFLKAIGISDKGLENLLTTTDWNIGDKYCVFGKDFEETFRNSFTDYKNIEDQVKKDLGDSKPIVAREVAKRLNINTNSIGFNKLNELKTKIETLSTLADGSVK